MRCCIWWGEKSFQRKWKKNTKRVREEDDENTDTDTDADEWCDFFFELVTQLEILKLF